MNLTYIVDKQLREAWAQIVCKMSVPGCEGIDMLMNRVPRRRTMLWAEPQQLILDVRWAEFARANLMWTFLLVQPHSDVEAQRTTYMASLRMAAPLNGTPFSETWKMSVAADLKIREEMGWPATFEEWQSMKSMVLAKKQRA